VAAFFKIKSRSIFPIGWGGYGDILQHGMTTHRPRLGGKLALERTGPYIPPITLPDDIVLTSEARDLLEVSGLSGFSFLAVEKALIVELHWESWNLNADEPAEYPESEEPEDYILGRPHSRTAATGLGELWEIVVPTTARILRRKDAASSYTDIKSILNLPRSAD
jgi:hypothetical protein